MLDKNIKKVLVIGSGPIVIGQAAEFDYAGVQACRALKEEGVEVVLINSNPATIMTDETVADKVYIEPLTPEFVEKIIRIERPDGLIASLGGQTGLNLAVKLADSGVLEKYNVRVLGTDIQSIKLAEDRELFKNLMQEIGEPIPASDIVSDFEAAKEFADRIGFPIIIRPAYTLGGSGGGIAQNMEEYEEIVLQGLSQSPINQVLVEKSIAGYKELEYEVVRDSSDTCIIVCNMENIDPIGIHTGDSYVVAPIQTATNEDCAMLRASAIKIIRALKIEGGCNVQFALDTKSNKYYVIEVNPRVSRSSALASKATGYPIAKITTKIALGYKLHEMKNAVTGTTVASFEPTIDYVVVKIPKWPFDKFAKGDRILGTKMKATGEVMAIGRTFASAFKKAITSLENKRTGILHYKFEKLSDAELMKDLEIQDDMRIFRLSEAISRGFDISELNKITKIDPWFINEIKNITLVEKRLETEPMCPELYKDAKEFGYLDSEIVACSGVKHSDLKKYKIEASFRLVDTCAGEFSSKTPYFYSTYGENCDLEDIQYEDILNKVEPKKKIMVLGSGPIRIGQGIEFDYCSVHASFAIQNQGYESIMVNSNPETLSTDFDVATRLYFEPMALENILNIIKRERPEGVMVQFGGQTAINLAQSLSNEGVKILGTSLDSIDVVEDRKLFSALLQELGIKQPLGVGVKNFNEAMKALDKLGFPVLIRPSYVIGGRGMQLCYTKEEAISYIEEAFKFSDGHPVLIDQYIEGLEAELDCVSDGVDVLIPGICEHIERAGVHSGDSMSVYPCQNIPRSLQNKMADCAKSIAKKLNIKGLMNIQFIIKNGVLHVIEVNPRASRTVPIMSKVTGINMVDLAVKTCLGHKLRDLGAPVGLYPKSNLVAVKMPIFSFQKLNRIDPALAPEMKSTGEVLGVDTCFSKALLKAFIAGGYKFGAPKQRVLISLSDHYKNPALPIIQDIYKAGYLVMATHGTHKFLEKNGVPSKMIEKFMMDKLQKRMKEGRLSFVLNTPKTGGDSQKSGFHIRTIAEMYSVPCFTSIDTMRAYLKALKTYEEKTILLPDTISNYRKRKFFGIF